ncbi:unnamed protein product [Scytosiphon promiscuus]
MAGAGGLMVALWLRERSTEKAEARSAVEDGGAPHPSHGGGPSPHPRAGQTGAVSAGRRIPAGSWHEADMTPPLPEDVVRLLQASRLCFLSTFSDDHPHLSLMNFTYYPGKRISLSSDEVIILSTRRDTKKYKLLQTGRNVAILVHEFPESATSGAKSSAGDLDLRSRATAMPLRIPRACCVAVRSPQEGENAERYRDLHAGKNPDSKTFIVGPHIAIITVRVRSARICNVRDEVTVWNVGDSHPGAK